MTPASDLGYPGPLIYVVDDEAIISELIRLNLEARRFRVRVFNSGETMLSCFPSDPPDLIILDVMLSPGASGVEIAGQVRANSQVPILMLSVMDQVATKLMALNIGADDYLTKPFEVDELVARVRAILRRTAPTRDDAAGDPYQLGELYIDVDASRVTVAQNPVKLTAREWAVLRVLVKNVGQAVHARDLLREAWGPDYGDENDYVRTHIARLRKKLEPDPGSPRYITSERGVGYRLTGPAA